MDCRFRGGSRGARSVDDASKIVHTTNLSRIVDDDVDDSRDDDYYYDVVDIRDDEIRSDDMAAIAMKNNNVSSPNDDYGDTVSSKLYKLAPPAQQQEGAGGLVVHLEDFTNTTQGRDGTPVDHEEDALTMPLADNSTLRPLLRGEKSSTGGGGNVSGRVDVMVQERVRRRERRRAEVNREYKVELVDCSEYAKQELRYVVGMMSRNFGSYERLLRPAGLTDNCQKRRFQANGQVRCAEMHPSIAGEAAYNSRCVRLYKWGYIYI
eukprot:459422-Prorocentrum_minimum.AAC.1